MVPHRPQSLCFQQKRQTKPDVILCIGYSTPFSARRRITCFQGFILVYQSGNRDKKFTPKLDFLSRLPDLWTFTQGAHVSRLPWAESPRYCDKNCHDYCEEGEKWSSTPPFLVTITALSVVYTPVWQVDRPVDRRVDQSRYWSDSANPENWFLGP